MGVQLLGMRSWWEFISGQSRFLWGLEGEIPFINAVLLLSNIYYLILTNKTILCFNISPLI